MSTEKAKISKINDARILVVVPSMGEITATLVMHLIYWAKKYPKGVVSYHFPWKVQPVERARNTAVEYFMRGQVVNGEKKQDYTHLFFVDADTLPPKDALEKLVEWDKDIISGLTPMLQLDKVNDRWATMDNCFTHQDFGEDGKATASHAAERFTGMQKIIRCGGSCLLIKRGVFDKLEKPFFKYEYNEDFTKAVRGEDIYFCDKAREAGIELWADTSVICNHYKEVML